VLRQGPESQDSFRPPGKGAPVGQGPCRPEADRPRGRQLQRWPAAAVRERRGAEHAGAIWMPRRNKIRDLCGRHESHVRASTLHWTETPATGRHPKLLREITTLAVSLGTPTPSPINLFAAHVRWCVSCLLRVSYCSFGWGWKVLPGARRNLGTPLIWTNGCRSSVVESADTHAVSGARGRGRGPWTLSSGGSAEPKDAHSGPAVPPRSAPAWLARASQEQKRDKPFQP